MEPDFTIISVTQNDIARIASAETEIFSDAWSEKALNEQQVKEQSRFYALFVGSHLAGYCIGDCVVGELEIYRIAVLPIYRRNGYARMLLLHSVEQAKAEHAFLCTLEVRVSNQSAIALYESCGFVSVGRRKNFYSHPVEDAFIMNLNINEEIQ